MFQLVYNLNFVHPKSMKLGQMATVNLIFYVVVSVYRSVKKTRPSSLRNFTMCYKLGSVAAGLERITWNLEVVSLVLTT